MTRVRSRWWFALLVLCALTRPGLAQLVAGAQTGDEADAHAWAVTPSTITSEWGLWHVPPRRGPAGAPDGSVRIVGSLERQPAAIAAAGGRVWLAFAGIGSEAGYGIFTAAVQPGAIEGTWFSGTGGRLAASAFLPTNGRLLSMAARREGPVALLEGVDGRREIVWLDRGRWRRADVPTDDGGLKPRAVAVTADGVATLAAIAADSIRLWDAPLPTEEPASSGFELRDPAILLERGATEEDPIEPVTSLDWTARTVVLPAPLESPAIVAGPVVIGPRLVVAATDGGAVRVLEIEGDSAATLYEARGRAVALLPGSRRGLIIRLGDQAQSAEGRAATRLELEEFSLDTGRTLYTGPAIFDGPVSPSDLRILLVLMVLVSASLLLFVVRSSNEAKPFVVPPGCVLAPAMPRVLASVGDGLLALLIGTEIARALPEGWLAMRIGVEIIDFAPLVMALAFGMLAGALMEATLGRTPGKLIFGLAVTRSAGSGDAPGRIRKPGLGASLVRNAVKWLLPLVALAGALSPLMRHRGDTLSGLGVVGELVDPEGSGDSDQDSTPDGR